MNGTSSPRSDPEANLLLPIDARSNHTTGERQRDEILLL